MCKLIVSGLGSGCTEHESKYEPKPEEHLSVTTATRQSLRQERIAVEQTEL
jgi:hypothetical protein